MSSEDVGPRGDFQGAGGVCPGCVCVCVCVSGGVSRGCVPRGVVQGMYTPTNPEAYAYENITLGQLLLRAVIIARNTYIETNSAWAQYHLSR